MKKRSKLYGINDHGEMFELGDDCSEMLDEELGLDTSEKPFEKEVEELKRLRGVAKRKTVKQLKLLS
jgi:hypothetical protein